MGRSVQAAASSSSAWPRAADFEDVSGISSKDSHPRDSAPWLLIWAGCSKSNVSRALSPAGNLVPALPHGTRAVWMGSLSLPKQGLQLYRDEL